MKESTRLTTPDRITLEFELAGPVSRFTAFSIDLIFIQLLNFCLILLLIGLDFLPPGWIEDMRKDGQAVSTAIAIVVFLFFITFWGYAVLFEAVYRGQTPGKRIMGIRVIREDGMPVGLRESMVRNLLRAVDMMPPPFYVVGGLAMVIDAQGRRLGDLAAGTLVIREAYDRLRGTRAGAAWAARAERGQARRGIDLPGGSLTADRLALIEQYLERAPGLPEERREELAWTIVTPLLPILGEAMSRRLEHRAGPEAETVLTQVLELARATEGSETGAPARVKSADLF